MESAVDAGVRTRFAKRQRLRWAPRAAHPLVQGRTTVLNGEGEPDGLCRGWYPAVRPPPAETGAVAA